MNFDNMPELHWDFGYAYAYVLFIGVVLLAVLMMWYMGLIKVCACVCWREGSMSHTKVAFCASKGMQPKHTHCCSSQLASPQHLLVQHVARGCYMWSMSEKRFMDGSACPLLRQLCAGEMAPLV